MAATGLTAGGLLVLAMIAVSVRGWLALPADARVPVQRGVRGYRRYQSKTAGLVTWPAAGVVIYALDIAVFAEDLATHDRGAGVSLLFLPAVLIVLFVVQIGAIRAAATTAAG